MTGSPTLQWQFTMSLDGFLAGPGGDMSWLAAYLGPNPMADEFMHRTGSLLVGNRTFHGDDPYAGTEHEGDPYGGGWSGPQFVLTHEPPADPVPGITFMSDLASAITAAKAGAGDHDFVGVLGADIARQCLEAGELAEILVFIAPVLLGDGVRVFERLDAMPVQLERLDVTTVPQSTNLRYRVL